jgi:predicted RNase H-like HicB family nuclease
MKKSLSAVVRQEDKWFVARCLEVDVASQGETEKEALNNLRDALALHFTPPVAAFSRFS